MTYVSMVSFAKGEREHAYFTRHFTSITSTFSKREREHAYFTRNLTSITSTFNLKLISILETYQASSHLKERTSRVSTYCGKLGFL